MPVLRYDKKSQEKILKQLLKEMNEQNKYRALTLPKFPAKTIKFPKKPRSKPKTPKIAWTLTPLP